MGSQGLVRRTNLVVSLKSFQGIDDVWRFGADAVTLDLRAAPPDVLGRGGRKWMRVSTRFAAYGGAEVFAAVDLDRLDLQLDTAVWPGLSGLVLSRAESADDLVKVDRALEELEGRRGLPSGSLEVIPVIETAKGVWGVREIIKASRRVVQVALDEGALALDLELEPAEEYDPFVYARGRVVIEATAAGVQPVGLPHPLGTLSAEVSREKALEEGTRAKDLGLKGALLSNARWVEPLNAAFSPTNEQVGYYTEVRRIFAEGVARGTAAVPLGERMIDVPVDEWAKAVLERAARCRERDSEKAEAVERGGGGT